MRNLTIPAVLVLSAMLFVVAILTSGCATVERTVEQVKPFGKCVPAYTAAIACTWEAAKDAINSNPPSSP